MYVQGIVFKFPFFLFSFFFFFFLGFYVFIHERQRERQGHRKREEKQAPCREPLAVLHPGTPGSCPEPNADAQPLSHPGIPRVRKILKMLYC